jgi:hypothetical protein
VTDHRPARPQGSPDVHEDNLPASHQSDGREGRSLSHRRHRRASRLREPHDSTRFGRRRACLVNGLPWKLCMRGCSADLRLAAGKLMEIAGGQSTISSGCDLGRRSLLRRSSPESRRRVDLARKRARRHIEISRASPGSRASTAFTQADAAGLGSASAWSSGPTSGAARPAANNAGAGKTLVHRLDRVGPNIPGARDRRHRPRPQA